ncbi:peptidyl-prolyl cis-trans isomerase FKBP13, chloroplastic [Henckelia pumila]|uniref:peptidyl-prolyl cis-trans isomerase FKBP13, chloroplastic n=1 Tax=Henckelia pumila TaxID=405737 RepID=UPI003C6E1A11
MNALPFSIGAYNPRTITTTATKKPYYCRSSAVKLQTTTSASTISRRELAAVGLGFCFSSTFILPQQDSAAANEATRSPPPCEFTSASSGLEYCDKVIGTGPEPVKGQLIKAHYVGKLENGKVFDSSYDRGKPLTFRVGVGEVIKGWDEGILGGDGIPAMSAGGKRKLRIPPALGYGIRGAGCRGGSCIIPPDSVLLFDVEFIGKA